MIERIEDVPSPFLIDHHRPGLVELPQLISGTAEESQASPLQIDRLNAVVSILHHQYPIPIGAEPIRITKPTCLITDRTMHREQLRTIATEIDHLQSMVASVADP